MSVLFMSSMVTQPVISTHEKQRQEMLKAMMVYIDILFQIK